MARQTPRARGSTRRGFFCCLAAITAIPGARGQSGKGRTTPSESARFNDSATEYPLTRLTSPEHASYLPWHTARILVRRGNALLFLSDRSGPLQAHRLDIGNGRIRQLTDGRQLHPGGLSLLPDDRNFCYFDGPVLYRASLSNLRESKLYEVEGGWEFVPGLSVTGDGSSALFTERKGGGSRLRSVSLRDGSASTKAESGDDLFLEPIARPKGREIVCRIERGGLWLAGGEGAAKALPVAEGRILQAGWSPDGHSVLYLHAPDGDGRLNTLREYDLESGRDSLLARTTQFVEFAPNADASAFICASGSKASPYMILLLRAGARERTLAEHRASGAARIVPLFSPNSQSIYFQSDRDGKPAIYTMELEGLIERTS